VLRGAESRPSSRRIPRHTDLTRLRRQAQLELKSDRRAGYSRSGDRRCHRRRCLSLQFLPASSPGAHRALGRIGAIDRGGGCHSCRRHGQPYVCVDELVSALRGRSSAATDRAASRTRCEILTFIAFRARLTGWQTGRTIFSPDARAGFQEGRAGIGPSDPSLLRSPVSVQVEGSGTQS